MRTARQISKQVKAGQKAVKSQPTKKVVDDIDDDDDLSIDIQWMKDRIDTQFFIDRDGAIHRYTGDLKDSVVSMHCRIASDLFPDIDYADDHVTKKLGWVLVGSTVYSTPLCYRKPTAAQMKTLADLGDWYVSRLIFPYKGSMIKYDQFGALCDD